LGLILLITILLLIYGSLFPFRFHAVPPESAWTMLYSWPAIDRFEVRDIAINVLIYLPIGLFGALWLDKGRPRATTPALTILLALALSMSMELLQVYDDSRQASLSDVVTNIAGAGFGILLARLYGRTLIRILDRPGMRTVVQPSGAMLLLSSWFAYQAYPLFPQVGLYLLREKLGVLRNDFTLPALSAIGTFVDWLAVAQLLEVVAGVKSGVPLLPLTMLLIPAKLLIVGRTFTWAEIAGAVCAWILWSTYLHRYGKRASLLAWLAASLLLMRGLAPYHWTHRVNPFYWAPLHGFFESGWGSATPVFLNKSFLYGTAVWLFHRAGYSYIRSAAGLAALLAVIEAAQMYLPGRSSEITDPVMVVILAVVLKTLDSSDRLATSPRNSDRPGP
jgi:VanZ family protein